MPYCTKQDIIDERLREGKLAELSYQTPQDQEGGIYPTLDTAIDAAIRDAGNLIDGYLQLSYGLPITDSVSLNDCKGLALDVVVGMLYERYGGAGDEMASDAYSRAVKRLEKIAQGKARLAVTSTTRSSTTASVASVATRVFTADDMKGW